MMRSLTNLLTYNIAATDGEMGIVNDFLFDDHQWIIRYVVADTGSWLPGKKVLLSPASVRSLDGSARQLHVILTREQVEQSPHVDSHMPVSRRQEMEMVHYYAWPIYWGPPGPFDPPGVANPPGGLADEADREAEPGDPYLRSLREVQGYHIQARDGSIGHVEDLIGDEEDWTVRYLVVDTRNWLPGRRVLLSPHWVEGIHWEDRTVHTDLSREAVRGGPEYDPAEPVNREYEGRLYDYYGRPRYWEEPVDRK